MKRSGIFECQFPCCGKVAFDRSEVDVHHIVSRSLNGVKKPYNEIVLCPGCHRMIHVPGVTHGIHKVKRDNSVVLRGYIMTTSGKALIYQKADGKDRMWIQKTKEDIVLEQPLDF
jgi:hypothetical protein